jgi:hypothetical protein
MNIGCLPELIKQGTAIMSEVYCEALKKELCGAFFITMRIHIKLLALKHCCSRSLTTLFTALISLQMTTVCLPT